MVIDVEATNLRRLVFVFMPFAFFRVVFMTNFSLVFVICKKTICNENIMTFHTHLSGP